MDASYFVFASRLHHDFENGLHFHPLRPFGNEMASAFYALKATPGFILADINSGRIGRANCLPKLPGRGKGKPGWLTKTTDERSQPIARSTGQAKTSGPEQALKTQLYIFAGLN